jgi:hypothetical protein
VAFEDAKDAVGTCYVAEIPLLDIPDAFRVAQKGSGDTHGIAEGGVSESIQDRLLFA